MKIVALEEHFVTPAIAQAWRELDPKYQDISHQLAGQPDLEERLQDLAQSRLQAMDASGVDVQVLSLTTPGTQNLEPSQAVELARQANDRMAGAVRAHPRPLSGVGHFAHARARRSGARTRTRGE